jgi:hypothetical protein
MTTDEKIRRLEREAATGDAEAAKRLHEATNRSYGVRSIFHAYIDKRVAIWCANYCEVGTVHEVYLDELGRAVAVLREVRRLRNEDANGPSWLGEEIAEAQIPSTAVLYVCLASDRPGW